MRCVQIEANLAAFVLDGLEEEEAAEVERHLTSCPSCQEELRELRKVSAALEAAPAPSSSSSSSSRMTPPSYLKDEILSRVRAERVLPSELSEPSRSIEGGGRRAWWRRYRLASGSNRFKNLRRVVLPSVAAAVAIAALGIVFGLWREAAPVATIQLVPTPQEATALNGSSYWGVAEIRPQPSGNQQVELKLNNFEEPKPRSYYELWFVSADNERMISAGSFTSVGEGQTRVLLNVPPEARNYHTLLITEERLDKGSAPSGEVALKGEAP